MSSLRITMSASFPRAIVPLAPSWNSANADPLVYAASAAGAVRANERVDEIERGGRASLAADVEAHLQPGMVRRHQPRAAILVYRHVADAAVHRAEPQRRRSEASPKSETRLIVPAGIARR